MYSTDYAILGISSLGTLLNICGICLLLNKQLRHCFYDFLRCHCSCNLIVCLLGLVDATLSCFICKDNFSKLCLTLVLCKRVALLASVTSDILLILNRWATLLDNKKSVFYKLSKKVGSQSVLLFTFFFLNTISF